MWRHNFRGRYLVAAITACTSQGFLLFGYDQGVMSGIIGAENRFGRDFHQPDANMQGNITSLYDIGCVVGSLLCFFITGALGRRQVIMAGGGIMIIGTILLVTATTVGQLIAGRVVTGFGNGINCATVPAYLSECAPTKHRGAILSIQGLVGIVGMCIAYWLDYGTSSYTTSFQWRFPLAFQGFFGICLVLQVIGLPESPRWLVSHSRSEEALSVIAALEDLPDDDEQVQRTLLEIQTAIEMESGQGPFQYRELFSMDKLQNGRRTALTISIMIMQQFTGANMINYYAPVVYEHTMNLPRHTSLILGSCTGFSYLAGSVIALFTTDKYGRRPVLMWSSAGLSLCFIVTSAMLAIDQRPAAYVAVAMVFLFQTFLGIGWHPVAWYYPSEINTTRVRTKAAALASASNWMTTFIVVKITPIAIANISWRIFIVFAVLNAIWILIVYCFYPETNGLSLEDINHIFEKGGITGGVFSSRGHPIKPHQHAQEMGIEANEEKDATIHLDLP